MLDIDMPKDKEEKPKRKFFPAPEVEAVAKEIISDCHTHLREAKISFTFRDGKWEKNMRPVPGSVKLMSPYAHLLTGLDFGIIINYRLWLSLNPGMRRAVMDHILAYCGFRDDDKTGERKWVKESPSVNEFPEVVSRRGMYSPDLKDLETSITEFGKEA